MKRFVACVAVWQGLMPRANAGWVVVDGAGVRIYDGKQRLLGEAPMAEVRYRRTRFAWGATTVWLRGRRFMLSAGGAGGVPADAGDLPDLSGHVESAALLQQELAARGAGQGKPGAPPRQAPPPASPAPEAVVHDDQLDALHANLDNPVLRLVDAASEGSVRGMTRALKAGAAIDGRHPVARTRYTALHIAAQKGRADIVRWLLERGASVNATDGDGNTALWVALLGAPDPSRALVVGQLLLAAGADPHLPNAAGRCLAEIDLPLVREVLGSGPTQG